MSPGKPDKEEEAAQPAESRVPPNCSVSGSGRRGALLASCVALRLSSPSHWRGFEGECKTQTADGLFSSGLIDVVRVEADIHCAVAAPRAPTRNAPHFKCLGESAPRALLRFRVIISVHGSGAWLTHCGNRLLRVSNGTRIATVKRQQR